MTPAAIIAVIRDVIILVAIGLLIYLLMSYGADIVKLKDMKAVQKQLQENSKQMETWSKQNAEANRNLNDQVAKAQAAIAAQHAPIFVYPPGKPPDPSAVSFNTRPSFGCPSGTGGADQRRGTNPQPVDIRPKVNELELKYEEAFAKCRSVLAKWPKKD